MANLWQFFGLPDPEGSIQTSVKKPKKKKKQKAVSTNSVSEQHLLIPKETSTVDELSSNLNNQSRIEKGNLKMTPPGWTGPVTSDGEPFHDLAAGIRSRRSFPTRALRYVSPDKMSRIPTRDIGKRINQGDTVIVDLRPLVHMDSHQAACRRELKHMSEENNVEIFSLDQEDKLLMIPGCDVIVETSHNDLGITALLH
ncbi:MAG TPA: hypothetical protein EYQ58_05110 [Candidatus Poseidoniales archaeon]|nr:hypothetical protein [Candidatus Poseidoniales archaeon]